MLQTLYIDPSVMTYAIQAIAGVAIAVGAIVVLAFRKAKKKITEKLNLEEKSVKEVEEEIEIIDDEENIWVLKRVTFNHHHSLEKLNIKWIKNEFGIVPNSFFIQ